MITLAFTVRTRDIETYLLVTATKQPLKRIIAKCLLQPLHETAACCELQQIKAVLFVLSGASLISLTIT